MPRTPPLLTLDPSLPDDVWALLRTSNPRLLIDARNGKPPRSGGPGGTTLAVLGGLAALIALVGGPIWFLFLVGMGTAAAILFWATGDGQERESRRRYQVVFAHAERFVIAEDLDDDCAALLRRAKVAVRDVLTSDVHKEGLLDTVDNELALPEEVWVIARRLRDLSHRRSVHAGIVGDTPHPLIADAVRPYDLAIETATASLRTRVAALEEYSAQAVQADQAFQARRKLAALEELAPEYERLLAETAPDPLAISHLARMTGHAEAVEQVFKETIAEARKAGTHLLAVTAA